MNKLIAFIDDLDQTYVQESLEPNTVESKNYFLHHISQCLLPFYRRKDTVFYDADAIDKFCNFMTEFYPENEYFVNLREQLASILENALPIMPIENTKELYFQWHLEKQSVEQVSSNTIIALTEEIVSKNNETFVLLILASPNTEKYYKNKKNITCFKDTFEDNKALPTFAKIDIANTRVGVENWIQTYRTPPNINKNSKHGEEGKGSHNSNKGNKVSPLLGTLAEAEILLETAIGDARWKRNLINYDVKYNSLIFFKYEGDNPQNQYHPFHLVTKTEITAQQIPRELLQELHEKFASFKSDY